MKRGIQRVAHLGARHAWLWRNRSSFKNDKANDQPRLLVDISAVLRHDAQTGIQRVVRAVWSELRRRSGNGVTVVPVFATSTHGYCYAPTDFFNKKIGADLEPVSVRQGDKFLGLDLSAHLLPKYRKQLRAWRASGASVHVVVYDLLPSLRPEWFTRAAVANFQKWLAVVLEDADEAICISDQVGRDLEGVANSLAVVRRLKISRLHMGADIAATLPSSGVCFEVRRLADQMRARPTVLMVGTIEPRKGYDVAIAAFEHLWRTSPGDAPDLVIVGKPGWKTTPLQQYLRSHAENGKRLHWLDSVTDEGLCLFYEACCGVVLTSHGEGFGLPLMEAALHRRHILARDLPVFREQGLPNVLYFKSDGPIAIGERVMDLVRAGATRPTSLPTWSESVDRLLQDMSLIVPQISRAEPVLRKAS